MFWATIGAMLYGSAMCWIDGNRKVVIVSWMVWLIGFFTIPAMFGSGWPLLILLQVVIALILIFRAKLEELL